MASYESPAEEWHDFLSGTHPHLQRKSPLRFVPSSPRCKLCLAPFGAPGTFVFSRLGFSPWEKNRKICGRCFKSIHATARRCPGHGGDREIAGAEVEISMLFADVRGSSKLARSMSVMDFTRLMQRFYKVSKDVLIEGDAIIEKFVGDEVVGLFLPFMTGPDHAGRAIETARALLEATGHGAADGPWCPLGAGVHSGTAFVGIVASEGSADFTALGDPMNVAAHLASQAAIGEILVTLDAAASGALAAEGRERRNLSLKGHPVEAVVLDASVARATEADSPTT